MTSSTSAYIAELPSPQKEIAEALRELIRKAGPALSETLKWSYPCWIGAGNVCSIIPYRNHVNLAFFRGAEFADPARLLEGDGKGMRHVKLRTVADVRARTLGPLLKEALKVDAQEMATTG